MGSENSRKTDWMGYCGVNCFSCPDYREGKCLNCRKSTWPEGDACPPIACCQKRGIEFCGQCGEFPCQMMSEFYEESEGHREAYARMLQFRGEATDGSV